MGQPKFDLLIDAVIVEAAWDQYYDDFQRHLRANGFSKVGPVEKIFDNEHWHHFLNSKTGEKARIEQHPFGYSARIGDKKFNKAVDMEKYFQEKNGVHEDVNS